MEILTSILEFCLQYYFIIGTPLGIIWLVVLIYAGYHSYEEDYVSGDTRQRTMKYYIKNEFNAHILWCIALTPLLWPIWLVIALIGLVLLAFNRLLPWFAKKLEQRVKNKYPELGV